MQIDALQCGTVQELVGGGGGKSGEQVHGAFFIHHNRDLWKVTSPMTLTLDLDPAESIALRLYAQQEGISIDEAAKVILQDALIGLGLVERPEADNDD